MKSTQHSLDTMAPTMLRLSEIERIIRARRIIVPPLSRRALIAMCENGTFETAPRTTNASIYLVTEESFLRWVAGLWGKKVG